MGIINELFSLITMSSDGFFGRNHLWIWIYHKTQPSLAPANKMDPKKISHKEEYKVVRKNKQSRQRSSERSCNI